MSLNVLLKKFPNADPDQFEVVDCLYGDYINWKVNGETIMCYTKPFNRKTWIDNLEPEMKKQLKNDLFGLD